MCWSWLRMHASTALRHAGPAPMHVLTTKDSMSCATVLVLIWTVQTCALQPVIWPCGGSCALGEQVLMKGSWNSCSRPVRKRATVAETNASASRSTISTAGTAPKYAAVVRRPVSMPREHSRSIDFSRNPREHDPVGDRVRPLSGSPARKRSGQSAPLREVLIPIGSTAVVRGNGRRNFEIRKRMSGDYNVQQPSPQVVQPGDTKERCS
jgi:hypothetical protein